MLSILKPINMTITITECENGYHVNVKQEANVAQAFAAIDFNSILTGSLPTNELAKAFESLKDAAPKNDNMVFGGEATLLVYINNLFTKPVTKKINSAFKKTGKRKTVSKKTK